MEELIIRTANLSDAKKVASCVNLAYEKYIVRINKKPAPMLDNYELLIREGNVYIGEYAGEIVGILVLKDFDDYILLDNVAVFPSYQGRGFGRQLILFAEDNAIGKNIREIRLYTNVKMIENINLYTRLGFVEYDKKDEDGYHRLYMKKML